MVKYTAYRPSGIDWIGDIPEHWEIKKIKHIKSESPNSFVDGPFGSNLKSVHFVDDGDVYVVESGFVTSGEFKLRKFKTITLDHFHTIDRSECKEGDIIISKIGANYGMSGILPKLDKQSVVSGNSLKLTINDQVTTNNFIHLILSMLKVNGEFEKLVTSTAQPALSLGDLHEIKFPLPPFTEQQAIAAYLDEKTKLIDNTIAKKQRLIELLQEERTAMINQAVTKGLDPNVKLKSSEIEWLGEIPEHWEVVKFDRFITLRHGYQFLTGDFTDEGIKVVKITQLKPDGSLDISDASYISSDRIDEFKDIRIQSGHVLMALTGGTIGKIIRVGALAEPLVQNYRVGNFVPNNDLILDDYIFWFLSSDCLFQQILFCQRETGQPNVGIEDFKTMKIVLPPVDEQRKIVTYIEQRQKEIKQLVSKEEDEMRLIQEYRTALIYEIVTGKRCIL